MGKEPRDHTLEYLLGYDGLIHWLDKGYSLRFVIKKIRPTTPRPHGLRYSFTLHDGEGAESWDSTTRIRRQSSEPNTGHLRKPSIIGIGLRAIEGRPYRFIDAETLVEDFFSEVYRELAKRGIPADVVNVTRRKD